MALGIRTGDKCVVAHRDPNEPTGPKGMICFRRFIFSHGEECEAEDGTMCRVFFGDCYEAEHLRKEKACLHAEYSIFFKYCVPKNRFSLLAFRSTIGNNPNGINQNHINHLSYHQS